MTRLLSVAMLALALGCASFQSTAGKVLTSTALTVDAAMTGWGSRVAAGATTTNQESVVKQAYQVYQSSMAVAQRAYVAAGSTGDKTVWNQASTNLAASSGQLLSVVNGFKTGATSAAEGP